MKKMMLISAIVTLAISGCTSDEIVNNTEKNDLNAISISPFIYKMQKGVDATTTTLASGISIYAYKSGDYTSTPFLNAVEFSKSGTYWTSNPIHYWPEYALDFFGFYPKTVKPTNLTDPTAFSYTVSPDASNEYDVVTSFKGNQNKEIVDMDYHHALSKISFKITTVANSGLNVTVNSIAVKNIPMTGDFVFDKTASKVPDYFTVNVPSGNATGIATNTPTSPVSVKASTQEVSSEVISGLYLIPHTLHNWAYDQNNAYPLTGTYININGALSGLTDYTGDIAIPITTTQWQSGYHYTYNIVFGNTSGTSGGGGYNPNQGTDGNTKPEKILMPIQISVTVDTWTDVTVPPVDL
ncbi:MAG: hypothetical protein ACRCSQ_04715 [Bacteroidales bacterium]